MSKPTIFAIRLMHQTSINNDRVIYRQAVDSLGNSRLKPLFSNRPADKGSRGSGDTWNVLERDLATAFFYKFSTAVSILIGLLRQQHLLDRAS